MLARKKIVSNFRCRKRSGISATQRIKRTVNRSSSSVRRKHPSRVGRPTDRPNGKFGGAHVAHVKRVRVVDSSRYASEKIASTTKRFGLAEFLVNFPSSCVVYPAPPGVDEPLGRAEYLDVILEGYYTARLTRSSGDPRVPPFLPFCRDAQNCQRHASLRSFSMTR